MLILAEGRFFTPIDAENRAATQAWLGPMVDSGFLHSAYLDQAGQRVWMVLSAEDRPSAVRRLADLPVVRDGSIEFTTTPITALRFT